MTRRTLPLSVRRLGAVALTAAAVVWSACADASAPLVEPEVETSRAFSGQVSPPGLSVALQAQARHGDALMSIPGVVGHGVGLDVDGRAAVVVYTLRPGIEGIPARVDGVITRPRVSGMFTARTVETDETARHRPAPLGVSVGHPDITAGTIGFKVKDGSGNPYILSNNHVLANGNDASIGDNILQPGPSDGGSDPADRIGSLADFVPIGFDGQENVVDAAIASVASSDVLSYTATEGYGQPSATTAEAFVNMPVQKYGRTTAYTEGLVDATNATVDICYETRGPFRCVAVARFVGQIIITPGGFSAGGDSGSGIVTNDSQLNPVGLLFAGSSSYTIANPIGEVLSRLGVTIDDGSGGGGDPGNDPPTAGNVAVSGDEDGGPFAWTPAESDPNAGDVLTCSIVSAPSNGAASVGSDCASGTYTPDPDFNGSDSFTYQVSDGGATDQGTVSVTVHPVNDAPVATGDTYAVAAGATLAVAAAGVLDNDGDVDGDALTASLVSGPSLGTLTLNADGSFTYESDGTTGDDSFTYRASDGTVASNEATVTITVGATATSMHVGGLTSTSINQGSTWDGVVTITVVDANGQPVEGATVNGTWSGSGSGSGICATGANGQCTVTRTGIHKRVSSVGYAVGGVSHSDLTYDGSSNVASSIQVAKP